MQIGHHSKLLFLLGILLFSFMCVAPVLAEYTTCHADNARTWATDNVISLIYNGQESTFTDILAMSRVNPLLPPLIGSYVTGSGSGYITLDEAGKVQSSPAISKSWVYFGTNGVDESGIYSVDLASRVLVGHHDVANGGVMSGITIVDERVYFGGIDGKLYSVSENLFSSDTPISTEILDQSHDTGLSSTPLVVGNTVYVTSQSPAKLWAFNTKTLAEVFNLSLEIDGFANTSAFSSQAFGNNGVIYTSGGPGLVKVTDNQIAAQYPANGIVGTPVVSDCIVYFTTPTTVYAVDASTLKLKWSHTKDWGESGARSGNICRNPPPMQIMPQQLHPRFFRESL